MKRKNDTNGRNSLQPQKNNRPEAPADIKQAVLSILKENPGTQWSRKDLRKRLRMEGFFIDRKESRELMGLLLKEGKVVQTLEGRYQWRSPAARKRNRRPSSVITGTISTTSQGFAFVLVDDEDSDEEIFIPPRRTGKALHGDRVEVVVYAVRPGKRREGEVRRVIERARTTFVGILHKEHSYYYVEPDNHKIPVDFLVDAADLNGARPGDKVVVELVEWPSEQVNPIGRIITVLGRPGDHDAEMKGIIAEFQLPEAFPPEVIKAAEALPDTIPPKEIARRRDLRDVPTFTIDPAVAKDFDDAVSIRPLEKGWWEVGVHIADVSHYVRPGSVLDKEAARRATSVYLVDRVIPMLPERLSNEICSLNPHEDKLTFSAVFEINENGKVRDYWLGRTVIRSDRRFTYEEAQKVIESGQGEYARELRTLNAIAGALRQKRFREGAVSFETPEVYFELDENGAPIAVHLKERKEAHLLIEDLMLLANRTVARFLQDKQWDGEQAFFAFRFHDVPPEEKMETFRRIAAQFGYEVDVSSPEKFAASLNRVMKQVEGRPEQYLLQTLAVRSMAKAFYTTRHSRHYGLAFSHYTHFTSPIRRYPDVIVHRLLDHYLRKGNTSPPWKRSEIEKILAHASRMEVQAEEAERAGIKLKQVEFMKDRIGETFDAIISGVTEWGIYVETTDTHCEGLVHIDSMTDDVYIFDPDNFLLVGMHKRLQYRLGDRVRVRLVGVDPARRHINFEIAKKKK